MTVLPDVTKADTVYTFKGEESWQVFTVFSLIFIFLILSSTVKSIDRIKTSDQYFRAFFLILLLLRT